MPVKATSHGRHTQQTLARRIDRRPERQNVSGEGRQGCRRRVLLHGRLGASDVGRSVDDSLELSDEVENCRDEDCPGDGLLKGNLTAHGFVGTWKSPDQHEVLAVLLKTVPAPDCDGKGAWRLFSDSRWPITFSYPASWRNGEGHDSHVPRPLYDGV